MALQTRGMRLARRYPVLKGVPEGERPEIVRKVLRHPKFLVPMILLAVLILPLYFDVMFRNFGVHGAPVDLFWMAKVASIMLVPICICVFFLTRYVVPWFLKKEMIRRGYTIDDK
jgi:hypothetical protein